MNRIIKPLFFLFLLAGCRNEESQTERLQQKVEEPARPPHPILSFDKIRERGVLIGYGMDLMDTTFNVIQEIDDYNELMVDITAVSRTYHSHYYSYFNSDTLERNPCKKFKYVKVKTKDFEGIVEGQYVYRIIDSPWNKIIKTGNNVVEFLATSNYEARQSAEETPCIRHTPLLLRDKKSGYEGLITLINREFYEIYFPYLEVDTSRESEETDKLRIIGSDYELTINSKFEIADSKGDAPPYPATVKLRKESNGKFTAKILEFE